MFHYLFSDINMIQLQYCLSFIYLDRESSCITAKLVVCLVSLSFRIDCTFWNFPYYNIAKYWSIQRLMKVSYKNILNLLYSCSFFYCGNGIILRSSSGKLIWSYCFFFHILFCLLNFLSIFSFSFHFHFLFHLILSSIIKLYNHMSQ